MTEKPKAALYARVSTQKQELDRQKNKLTDWAERNDYSYDIYSEKASSVKERPEYDKMIDNIEYYDTIAVTKIDRFGRSLTDILNQINYIRDQDTEFITIEQPINTGDDLMGEVMTNLLALFSEFERKMIRRRMEEGWQEAYEEGRVGRPEKLTEQHKSIIASRRSMGYSYKEIALYMDRVKDIEVSESTIYRILDEKELTQKN
jgi:DNA invertase Pin-like site-specific DNA recombinase